jgi:hypothetical protein
MNGNPGRALGAAGLALVLSAWGACASAQGDAKRGAYLVKAGGCLACHTADGKDAVPYAGGRALKTPFGTFYGPNITPHPETGIGRWSEADFVKAMRQGVRPDGANYFPSFPYPSFTLIADADLRDMWALSRHVLEVAVLLARPVRPAGRRAARGGPGRLPGAGAGALRRVPHAA